jgi:U-box domain
LIDQENDAQAIISAKRDTKTEYARSHTSQVAINVISKSYVKVAVGCTVGAIVGGAVGGGVGFSLTGLPGIIPGALIGSSIGASVGATTMLVLTVHHIPMIIESDSSYHDWKLLNMSTRIHAQFAEQISKDEVFSDLCCPLSYELPEIPVKAPCGHIYNKAHIEAHIDRKTHSDCSMIQGLHFTKSDLVFNHDHLRKILRRAIILKHTSESEGDKKVLCEGLEIVVSAGKENLKKIARKQFDALLESSMDETEKVYSKEFDLAKNEIVNMSLITTT